MELSKQFIKDIRPGEEVKSVFFTQRKELRKTRRGDLYISLELADRSGSVEAKIWDQVAKYKDSFSEKEFVAVNGRAGIYQDQLQLEIKTIRRCREEEVDLEQFLRKARADLVELEETLRLQVSELKERNLRELLGRLLEDEGFMERFRRAPAAKSYHHPYLGGLLEHTVSVALVCDKVCNLYPGVDRELLISAAILHDVGKIKELEYGRAILYSDEGRFLGHLVLGDEMVRELIQDMPGFPPELEMRLRHAILSHHGELEWGSPKQPMTMEALILHHVDNLDAKANSFMEVAERRIEGDGRWTDMRNLFKRPLYVPKAIDQERDLPLEEGAPY
jgi:3'-5' exoribonuclease